MMKSHPFQSKKFLLTDISALRQFAVAFRARLDAGRDSLPKDACAHFPAGCCGIASEALAEAVRGRMGLAATYVCGSRHSEAGWTTHAWLEVDGVIIDLTGDQFGRPAVVVTTDRSWHDDNWPDQERRAQIDPSADPIWWAWYGWPVYRLGVGD
jgi:hypothetical protein